MVGRYCIVGWRSNFNLYTLDSGVDKGEGKGALSPLNELKDHPCDKMKSEEKLRGAMTICNPQK